MPTEWFTGSWFLDLLNWSMSLWNQTIESGAGILMQSPEAASPGIWNIMEGINTSMQGIGYGLLVLFFLIGLFKNTTNLKEFSLQGIFGYFLRFAGAKLAIDYSMQIMSAVISIVLEITGLINASGADLYIDKVPDNIASAASSMGIFDTGQFSLWLLSIAGVLITCICSILFMICVYGRFFRVYIHIALAPIGLSTLGGETTASTGKKYIMSFISVCLEAAVIMLAIVICKGVVAGGMFNVTLPEGANVALQLGNYIMSSLFAMVLVVTLTFSVNRMTKEMFGG